MAALVNLHHYFIHGVAESFQSFRIGMGTPIEKAGYAKVVVGGQACSQLGKKTRIVFQMPRACVKINLQASDVVAVLTPGLKVGKNIIHNGIVPLHRLSAVNHPDFWATQMRHGAALRDDMGMVVAGDLASQEINLLRLLQCGLWRNACPKPKGLIVFSLDDLGLCASHGAEQRDKNRQQLTNNNASPWPKPCRHSCLSVHHTSLCGLRVAHRFRRSRYYLSLRNNARRGTGHRPGRRGWPIYLS